MEKLFRRVVSLVCAVAMVVAGLAFTPAKVDAATGTVPVGQEVQVGAWGLFTGDAVWAGETQINYVSNGSALGDTTMTLVKSPYGHYNQVKWGTYFRLKNYLSKKSLVQDETYRLKITADIHSDSTDAPNETSGRNVLLVNIQGDVYKVHIDRFGDNVEYTATQTFDYDPYITQYGEAPDIKNADDLYIYTAGLKPGTDITIKAVDFDVDNDGWSPVPNWDPEQHQGQDAQYTQLGKLSVLAMHSPTDGLYGQLKYKKVASEDKVSDYSIRVTSPGWTNYAKKLNDEKRSSWAASIRLKDYMTNYSTPLVEGNTYTGTLKVDVSKATDEDNKGRKKTLMYVIDGKIQESRLTAGVNEIEIPEFEYSGEKPDIDIDLDGLEAGTDFTIVGIDFTKSSSTDWIPLPNNDSQNVGRWELYARFATGEHGDDGQWGKLSYAKAPGVTGDPEKMEDTLIKVRSSSGWYNAWATLATAHHYIDQEDDNKLQVGQTYYAEVEYYSNKATGEDTSGRPKEMLLSVDGHQLTFPLEKCDDSANYDTYKTAITDEFVYDAEQVDNDPTAVVLNMDRIDPGTILRIKDIRFKPVLDAEWTPVKNDKWVTLGTTNMQAYGNIDVKGKTGSWGKVSYKFDTKKFNDFSDVTILNRSVSGWYVGENTSTPGNAIDFLNVDQEYDLHKGWTYTATITFQDEVRDQTAIDKGTKNEVAVVVDGHDYDHSTIATLKGNNQETVVNVDEFVYTENSPDLRIVMDRMTKNSTLKVKSIKFEHKSGEPEYQQVYDDTPLNSDPWVLYCTQDSATETWGDMLYAQEKGDGTLGDTEIYCYGVSGWIPGKYGLLATLKDWTQGKMKNGENYSVAMTIESSEDNYGHNPDSDKPDSTLKVRAVINGSNYDFEVYKGTHTYVIPSLSKDYTVTESADIQFVFDSVRKGSKFKISEITWDKPIEKPVEVNNVKATVDGSSATVTWEQTPNTIYGTLGISGSFKIYDNGKEVATVNGNTKSYTLTNLSNGTHTIKVCAILGAYKTSGKTTKVEITDKPTVKPTTKPTVKPTTKPTKKPGKATVKKVVKKKKSAKKIKVTLKKVAGATKYQVRVFKSKKAKKALVTKIVTKLKATIKSKKLKGKKTVYVKARAWNKAGYGAWSKAKKSKKK